MLSSDGASTNFEKKNWVVYEQYLLVSWPSLISFISYMLFSLLVGGIDRND